MWLAAKYGLGPENPTPSNEREGNEFFSIVNGKKTDAHLHEEILAGADPVAVDKFARQNARNIGFSEQDILSFFGPPLTESE